MSAACHAKKTPFPAFPASGKRAGAPSGEKADNLSPHFGGEHDACSLHSGESWGEEKRKWGIFVEKWSVFLFFFPLSPVGCAFHPISRPCVCTQRVF